MKGVISFSWICSVCNQKGTRKTKKRRFNQNANRHNNIFHHGKQVLTQSDRYIIYELFGNEYWIPYKDYLKYRCVKEFWELLDKTIEKSVEYYNENFKESDKNNDNALIKQKRHKKYIKNRDKQADYYIKNRNKILKRVKQYQKEKQT